MWGWRIWEITLDHLWHIDYYLVPKVINPTKSVSFKKVSRSINRLLPVGNRWRGDVGTYA
jgi:hypothetical protein